MRVLLIACSYPPDPVVGSFRAAKLARAFSDAGHEVDVITTRSPGETETLRVNEPHLRVHTVREVPGPAGIYSQLKARLRGHSAPPAPISDTPAPGSTAATRSKSGRSAAATPDDPGDGTPSRGVRSVPRWKRYLFSALWVPDNRKGFVPAAVSRARPIMREGVDLIYTTAPPFSVHLAGLILRLTTGVRWVAEFRDPWIENKSRMHLRSRGSDAVNRWLERTCVKRADQLVAVSEGTRDLLAAKLPERRHGDVLLALNGIDNLAPRSGAAAGGSGPFRISHIGSCYGGRDPRPFLHALSRIVKRREFSRDDVHVEFIGNCRRYLGESLEHLVGELGLTSIVDFHDWLPQAEARARAGDADLFLLPFPNHQRLIPNKLYDYLGFRKPILAIVHPDGETARLLRGLGGHWVVTDNSIESTEAALEQALANRGARSSSEDEELLLTELTTERQMEKLLAALNVDRVPRRKTHLVGRASG